MKIGHFDELEMIRLSQRAVGRIDSRGRRGAEEMPLEEIEAMACLLATLGIVPIPDPGPASEGGVHARRS